MTSVNQAEYIIKQLLFSAHAYATRRDVHLAGIPTHDTQTATPAWCVWLINTARVEGTVLENRLGSLVQTFFIGEIASVFWLDQTVLVIIADGPKDIEPCIEISPRYFLFSFRLIVHAPLLLLSLHFSLSLCCSVCFLWRKYNWVISSSSFSSVI